MQQQDWGDDQLEGQKGGTSRTLKGAHIPGPASVEEKGNRDREYWMSTAPPRRHSGMKMAATATADLMMAGKASWTGWSPITTMSTLACRTLILVTCAEAPKRNERVHRRRANRRAGQKKG